MIELNVSRITDVNVIVKNERGFIYLNEEDTKVPEPTPEVLVDAE